MLELDGAKALYLCDRNDHCKFPCFGECEHTTNPEHAKNIESVELFKRFMDSFNFIVDDDNKLICWEKEK